MNAIKKFPQLGVNGISSGNITSCYFDSNTSYVWTNLQSAFKAAVLALTKVDGGNPQPDANTNLATNLNNALNALCTKVTLNANGGTFGSTSTIDRYVQIGTAANVAYTPASTDAPTRAGYTFAGWARTSSGAVETTPITVGYNNTLYAKWTPNTYTVHFKGNGNTGGSTADQGFTYESGQTLRANGFTRAYTVTYNHNYTGSTDTSATATYTFKNWMGATRQCFSDSGTYSGSGVNVSPYHDFKSYTVNQPFAAGQKYILEFDAKGTGNLINYFYGNSGYLQCSNATSSEGVTSSGTDGNITHALTDEFKHYTITWTLGSSGSGTVNKIVLFRLMNGNNTCTIKNVNFYQAEVSSNAVRTFTNQQTGVTNLTSAANGTYYRVADWTPKSITLETPTRNGYTFGGWYKESSCTNLVGAAGASYTPKYNQTIYAKWTATEYTISYYDSDGTTALTGLSPTSYTIESPSSTVLPTPSKTGYTFTGWKAISAVGSWNTTTTYNAGTSLNGKYGSVSLKATWQINSNTVTLNPLGGTGGTASVSATYGSAMPSATMPTKDGYNFDGYYDTYNSSTGVVSGTQYYTAAGASARTWNKTSDTTLYAKWSLASYTITYVDSDGTTALTGLTPTSYNITSTSTLPAASKTGYTFGGWEVVTAVGNWSTSAPYAANTSLTGKYGSVTLKAIFNPISFTVTYFGNGATGGSMQHNPQTFTYNSGATLDTNGFTRSYTVTYNYVVTENAPTTPVSATSTYSFNGWNTAANGSGTAIANGANGSTLVTTNGGNLDLYAQWTGGSVTLPNPSRPNSAIEGWYTSYNSTTGVYGGTRYNPGASFTPTANVTLYAKWADVEYTIAYDANGATSGTAPASQTNCQYYTTYTLASNTGNLAKTGYNFTGWNTAADGSGTHYATGASVSKLATSGTFTFYAEWTAKTYQVRFYNNDTTSNSNLTTQTYASAWVDVPTVSRTGYTFGGWYENDAGTGSEVAVTGTYAHDHSGVWNLYAKWTGITYTVTYNKNTTDTVSGMPTPGSFTKTYGTAHNLSSVTPTRTGYTFAGWNTASDGSGTTYGVGATLNTDLTTTAGDNVTLYAMWTANTYVIDYAKGAASATGSTTSTEVRYDQLSASTVFANCTFTYTGHTFEGWSVGGNTYDAGDAVPAAVLTANGVLNSSDNKYHLTATATWDVISYDVAFNGNGANSGSMNNQSFDYDESKALTSNAYGRTYRVTYNYNDATGGNSVPYADVSYTFAGWHTSALAVDSATPAAYSNGQTVSNLMSVAGTYQLFAKWTSNSTTLPIPTRNGYTFDGWYLVPGLTGTSYAGGDPYTPADNVTLYAKWTINNYTITYKDSHNPNYTSTQNYNINSNDALASLSETGYDFAGWDVQVATAPTSWTGTHYSAGDPLNGMYGNVTLVGQWTAHTYTVTYNANTPASTNGTVNMNGLTQETKTYGTAANLSSATPSLTGYIFGGWSLTANGAKAYDAGDAIPDTLYPGDGGNVDIYAIWTPVTYTIAFDKVDPSATGNVSSQTKTYDAQLTLNTNYFQLTGYTFRGWALSSGGSKVYNDGATLTADLSTANGSTVTLYAVWEANGYWVRFNGNGESSGTMSNQRFVYDVAQNLTPNAFHKEYTITYNYNSATVKNGNDSDVSTYDFTGWNTQTDGYGVSYSNTQNVVNLTSVVDDIYDIYAQWSNANAGVTLPVPTRTGYTFEGWYDNSSFTGAALSSPYTATEDITLYAKWQPRPYTITYHYNVANAPASQNSTTVYYDTEFYYAPADHFGYRLGYTIEGWSTDPNAASATYLSGSSSFDYNPVNLATGEPGDTSVDLYAVWTTKKFNVTFVPNTGMHLASGESATKQIAFNGSVTFTVELEPGYTQATGRDAAAYVYTGTGAVPDGIKNAANNTITFTVTNHGETDMEVRTQPLPLNTYNVTLQHSSDNGATITAFSPAVNGYNRPSIASTVTHGSALSFNVALLTGYNVAQGSDLIVSATSGGTTVTPAVSGSYTYTIAGSDVTGDVVITLGDADKNSSTVKFDANGGKWAGDVTLVTDSNVYGQTYTVTAPAKDGYTFAGWQRVTSGANASTANGSLNGNTYTYGTSTGTDYYEARWTANTYTITFSQLKPASDPAWSVITQGTLTKSVTYGGVLPAIDNLPTRVGYDFLGYTLTDGGTDYWYSVNGGWQYGTYTVAGNTTLYAKWAIHNYSISLDGSPMGYSVVYPQTANYDDTYTIQITPDTGYNVNALNVNVTGSAGFTTSVSGGVMTVTVNGVRADNLISVSGALLTYNVTTHLTNPAAFASVPAVATVNYNTSGVTVEVQMADGYQNATPTLTMDTTQSGLTSSIAKKSGTDDTYVITVSGNITADIDLYVTGIENVYTATLNGSEVGYTLPTPNSGSITYLDSTSFVITLASGYTQTVPADISVTTSVNGHAVLTKTDDTHITVEVFSDAPGNVTVTLGNAKVNTYTLTFINNAGDTLTVNTPVPAASSSIGWFDTFTFSVTLADGYTAATPALNSDNVNVTVSSSKSGSVVTYTVNNYFTANTVLTLEPAAPNTSTLTVSLAGGNLAGVTDGQAYNGAYKQTQSFGKPTKTGYTFSAWVLGGDNNGTLAGASSDSATYTFGKTQGAADTLTATYTANTYKVRYYKNDGSEGYTDLSVTYGSSWPTEPSFSRTGYEFDGWFAAPDGNTSVDVTTGTYNTAGDTVVYAHWAPHTGTLVVDANGGTVTIGGNDYTHNNLYSEVAEVGTQVTIPDPVRSGYNFTGWQRTNENGTFANGVYTYGSANNYTDTLTAQWSKKTYTVIYHYNADGSSTVTSRTAYYDTPFNVLGSSAFTRTGYTLTSWNTSADGSGTAYALNSAVNVNLCTCENGDVEYHLYAVWQINSSVAQFDPAGGTLTVNGTGYTTTNKYQPSGSYGTQIQIPDPVKTGYDFAGWTRVDGSSTNGTLENRQYTFGPAASSAPVDMFEANWTAKTYTVTYVKNDGTNESATRTATYNETWPAAPEFTRTGYTFTGWYTTSACTVSATVTGTYTLTSGTTVYAGWTKNRNTVTFDPTDGTLSVGGGTYTHASPYSVTNDYGETLTVSAVPVRTGYTFTGWLRSASSTSNGTFEGNVYTFGSTVNKTDVYEAQWQANTYTVTYYKNDGTGLFTNLSVVYGSSWPTAPSFSRTGYTFDDWYTLASGGTTVTVTGTYNTADNTEVYAHWTPVDYTITYVNDGVTTTAQYDIESTGTISVPADRAGYTFTGWRATTVAAVSSWTQNTIYNGTSLEGQYGDVTLTAVWTRNTYTVVYDGNGGAPTTQTEEATYGLAYPAPAEAPSRTGYDFAGWFTLANGGTEIDVGTDLYELTNGTTLYAHWSVHRSSFTVDPNGGSVTVASNTITASATYTDDYGAEYQISVPVRTGYTFTGWTENVTHGTFATVSGVYRYTFGPDKNVTDSITANWTINTYDVTLITGAGYTVDTATQTASPVNYGTSYSVTINLSDGYSGIPTATVNNGTVVVTDNGNGSITYRVDNITEDKTITIGSATRNFYNVTITKAADADGIDDFYFPGGVTTVSVEHSTGTATVSVELKSNYSESDAPAIELVSGGSAYITGGVKTVVNGKTIYTYTVYNVRKASTFEIQNAFKNRYVVSLNDTRVGYTIFTMPQSPVDYNENSSVTILLDEAYSESAIPAYSVTVNGTEYSDASHITAVRDSSNSRKITYTARNIVADTQINIGSATINTYDVHLTTAQNGGYTLTSVPASSVTHGGSVTFTVTLGEAYSASAIPAISATNAASAVGYKDGNVITYVVTGITGNSQITVGAAQKNSYTVTVYPGIGVTLRDANAPYAAFTNGQQFTVYHGDTFEFTMDNTGSSVPPIFANGNELTPVNGKYTVTVTSNVNITTGNVTYTATFVNYDNEILESYVVPSGGSVSYTGATPVRPSSECHEYVFTGWMCTRPAGNYALNGNMDTFTENRVFKAQYAVVHQNLPITSDGTNHWWYCTECDYTEGAANHTAGEKVIRNEVPSSCTVRGSHDEYVYCTVCGHVMSSEHKIDEFDYTKHSTTKTYSEIAYEATCSSYGLKIYYCVDCNHPVMYLELPMNTGVHTWGPWMANGDNKTHSRTCVYCGEQQNDKYHNLREIYRIGATCTEDGRVVSLCPDCSTVITQILPATGKHIAGDPVRSNVVAATCVSEGSYDSVRYCTMCHMVLEQYTTHITVPATGIHEYGDVTYTVDGVEVEDYNEAEVACGARVVETSSCKYCDDVKTEEYTIEHEYEWAITTPATPSQKGIETGTCARCGDTITRELDYEPVGERSIQFVAQDGVTYKIPYEKNSETGAWVESPNNPTTVKDRIMFYTNVDLKFFVYVTSSFAYSDYDVFVDGVKAAQNADGSFTIPASASGSSVTVVGTTPTAINPGDSGVDNGGNTGKISFWQRIINFFRSITDFFRNLFSR
ncbi:MAG: InlB B-repeat-containing protein [Clostridia bacterium]|nr:InlB B-repeat-containing protein [Clostridia bacterium]